MSSNTRLDEKVYLTMGALCLISILILAFSYASHNPCSPVKIQITGASASLRPSRDFASTAMVRASGSPVPEAWLILDVR